MKCVSVGSGLEPIAGSASELSSVLCSVHLASSEILGAFITAYM